ncbi:unnamed protein product [Discosporangium mesarthrocarpum]
MSVGSLRSKRSDTRSYRPTGAYAPMGTKGGPTTAHVTGARAILEGPQALDGGSHSTPVLARVTGRAGGFGHEHGDGGSDMMSRDVGSELEMGDVLFVYKVSNSAGHTYRIRASAERLNKVMLEVGEKLKCDHTMIQLKYLDDEGDEIMLSGDDSLHEAVDMARASGLPALKLVAAIKPEGDSDSQKEKGEEGAGASSDRSVDGGDYGRKRILVVGGSVAVAVSILAVLVLSRRR